MTTDNAQELDDILNKVYQDGEYYEANCENVILDGHNSRSISNAKQAILDWHNKQVVQSELDILNHLLRTDKYGAEPTAHLIRLRAIQMQGSAESRLDTGRLRRVGDD